ncbi:MAG: T9SS type A sorting domain-containing protein, partial [Calditrichaeota bacterium]|nr:T9SS type A sorting domain-containing protein [Calditrichota bacterium]
GFGLTNAYPNPFNNVVNLEYTLPINQTASLKVYDMTGKLVDTISGNLQGEGTVSWNASGVQSGVYMMQLESGNQVSLKKVILMQ